MEVIEIFSPIDDKQIYKNLIDSPIWSKCFTKDELTETERKKHTKMFKYSVKFNGLRPVQVTKITEV